MLIFLRTFFKELYVAKEKNTLNSKYHWIILYISWDFNDPVSQILIELQRGCGANFGGTVIISYKDQNQSL